MIHDLKRRALTVEEEEVTRRRAININERAVDEHWATQNPQIVQNHQIDVPQKSSDLSESNNINMDKDSSPPPDTISNPIDAQTAALIITPTYPSSSSDDAQVTIDPNETLQQMMQQQIKLQSDIIRMNQMRTSNNSNQSQVKLQKYTITPFRGGVRDWVRFNN